VENRMAARRTGPRRQRGVVSVMIGVTIMMLLLMLGLVLDLGHLYIVKTELQNAADSCALSAARELATVSAATAGNARTAGTESISRATPSTSRMQTSPSVRRRIAVLETRSHRIRAT